MRGIGAGTRIFELLDRTPAVQPGEGMVLDPARSGPLRFENIAFSYPTRRGVNVLEDFDLEINVGENVAIVYVLPFCFAYQVSNALLMEKRKERGRQVIDTFSAVKVLRPRQRQGHI
jgi:hypothetical protein